MTTPLPLSRRVRWSGEPPISYLIAQGVANPGVISLAAGLVDEESLPIGAVREAFDALWRDPARAREALQYGTTPGDLRLRRKILDHLASLEGESPDLARIDPRRVIMGTGSQQLLHLLG